MAANCRIPAASLSERGFRSRFHLASKGHSMQTGRTRRSGGFTFVEMMVTVTIMVIILAMAIPTLSRSIQRAKESVLRNNLTTLRHVLDDYCYDKAKCPQSLQDLVTEGYLRAIPSDPMNNYATE